MSDRELLELAAKAAGIAPVPYTWDKGSPWGEHEGFTVSGEGPNEWNPLEDDGDALELAVKLQISVMFQSSGVEARSYHGEFFIAREAVSYETGDVATATRAAIVRAAAEIGRQMP